MNTQSKFLLTAAGWLFTATSGCATLPPDAVQRVRQANTHYQQSQYGDASRLLNIVIRDFPETKGVGEAYYIRGLCRLQSGERRSARADFDRALQVSQRPELLARVHGQLGHLDYTNDAFDSAAKHYEAALPDFPNQRPKDEILYRYANSLQKLGKWRKSREVFPKVWHLFPDSELAPYARRKFAWEHDYFAIQCGAFKQSSLAHDLANTLRQRRLQASVAIDLGRSDAPHTVYVGSFTEYSDARRSLSQVQQQVAEAFIVP